MPRTEKVGAGNTAQGSRPFVTLTQRAVPLLELLEWALKKEKLVVWGV